MKTKTLKTKTAGTNSAAPIAVALLAGVAVGAIAYAKRRELAAVGATGAKMLDPVVTGAKSKFGKTLDAVTTRMGDIVMNFGEAVDQARKLKAQRVRNPEMMHPQQGGESLRAVS